MNRILQLLFVSLITLSSFAQTTTIWSGDKNATGNSNNIALASAKWAQPHSMCTDALGNIWVSDDANHCIKLIKGGTVYTRVGSQYAPGTAGAYGYTNAFSSSALFNTPRGIVCDASNNIYVCDWNNNAIRKISAFTTIGNAQGVTTLCGAPETTGIAQSGTTDGTGTSARFYHPSGICKDNSGNFYVTDEDNHMIRKIVIATGAVTTLCGTASGVNGGLVDGNYATAKFKSPRGITYISSENALYVSDFGNGRIRKIDLTAQTVTVWVGGTNGFQGSDGHRINSVNVRAPEGITYDLSGNLLFVSSLNAHTLRRCEKTSNNVFTFAGVHQTPGNADGVYTDARFNAPTGLMLSSDNTTLYVCDNGNGLIRAIDMRPVVEFTSNYTALATGAIATMKDTSLSMVSSWAWTITPGTVNIDFAYQGGTNATSKNPQIKFNNPGTYTVKLNATNTYGTGTKTRTSYIVVSNSSGAPTSDFVADKVLGNTSSTFVFTNQTTNNSGCTYSWVFNPATISYLNTTTQNSTNPQVRFSNVGFYSVTLNVTHPTFTVTPKVKTNYIQVTGVGIQTVKNDFTFGIFPNPNHGTFTFVTSESLKNATASVLNIQGQEVANISLNESNEQTIQLPALSNGVYFIKVMSADKIATQRIVIQ